MQLSILLDLFCKEVDREVCLGIWTREYVYQLEKPIQILNVPVIWIHHDSINHWAGIAPNHSVRILYCEELGKGLCLGVWSEGSIYQVDKIQDEDSLVIWTHHDGKSH